jgi:site-specific DNA recombinase
VTSATATDRLRALIRDIARQGVKAVAPLLRAITIGKGRLRMHLTANLLAEILSVGQVDLDPDLLTIDVPFSIRRRGVEMKIVAGNRAASPDATLIRALRNAHVWVRQMKEGAAIRQVARNAAMSESYVARILPLAFLSPLIQQSILAGTQPVTMTLETIVRARLPMAWPDQELLLGLIETA